MPRARGKSLSQLKVEADHWAKFCFDPTEQDRIFRAAGAAPGGDYAVVLINTYVPVEIVPQCKSVLRKFVRGGTNVLDEDEKAALERHRHELDVTVHKISDGFAQGLPASSVKETAQSRSTWPAVAVADSEEEMRSLLMLQFEMIRKNDVLWQCVDSSTYTVRGPKGVYLVVEWFWHGS